MVVVVGSRGRRRPLGRRCFRRVGGEEEGVRGGDAVVGGVVELDDAEAEAEVDALLDEDEDGLLDEWWWWWPDRSVRRRVLKPMMRGADMSRGGGGCWIVTFQGPRTSSRALYI